jgi:4-hydroxy-2-oxoheptanedioate aldolase
MRHGGIQVVWRGGFAKIWFTGEEKMRKSVVLEKLRKGEPVFCFKCNYLDPDIVEMMGVMGVDVTWLCNEHLELDPSRIKELARAGRAGGVDTLLRKPFSGNGELIRPLEAGVSGLMIPHCVNAEMVEKLVNEVKFTPLGGRGYDGVNADSDFGMASMSEYMEFANRETFLMIQIEDAEAVDNIDEMAEVKGVDLMYVGPADLSLSMGYPGEFKHPKTKEVVRKVVDACARNGIWSATSGIDSEYTKELLDVGVNFISVASDYGFLRNGIQSKLEELKNII